MIITGTTYSVTHYDEYKKTGNSNIFEEVIDSMVLDGIAGMNDSFRSAISNLPIEDKRMAILSLLDKDLNLFKKIKALTNKSIDRLEHIKDIILMLREYVKVGEVEKKKFGEVMTPLELVKEMIATLPEEVWSNPNLKWLDPANGTGPYPSVVIYKLMNGLEEWEPDAEKRYKHIIENMIYTCELQAKNVFLWLCVADPFDEYTTNTYWGSFLDEGFDKHMKEVWGVERFDIILGNPPYNDSNEGLNNKTTNLYNRFVNKSVEISNSVLMITPARWLGMPNMASFRDGLIDSGLCYIRKYDGEVFKNASIDGGVCFFLVDQINNNGSCKFKIGEVEHENSLITGQPIIINNNIKIINSILEKTKRTKFLSSVYKNPQRIKSNDKRLKELPTDSTLTVLCSKSKIKYIESSDETNLNPFHSDKFRVIFERVNGGYKKTGISNLRILEPDKVTTQSISFFPTSSLDEANSVKSFLETKLSFFLRDINQFDKNFTSLVFDKIPVIEFNRIWTDTEVYEYFNLNESEINFIENYTK